MLPDITGPETYGLPKSDYDSVVNPETDLSAAQYESLAIDVSALTCCGVRAWAKITGGATPIVASHGAVWGATNSVKPTVVRNSAGTFTITWAASYYDLNPTPDRRVLRYVNFKTCWAQVHDVGVTPRPTIADAITSNSIRVVFTDGSNFDDPDSFSVFAI